MTNAVSLAQYGSTGVSQGFKNRIINGAMVIDQRYAGAATANTINGYTLDRWRVFQSVAGKFTVQQNAGSVTPPAGFNNYLGVTSVSAYSVGAGDYYLVDQPIEGFNVADLGWGASTAQTVTVSFWVRSSLTGTFGASISNESFNRTYPFTYTISSANTWEYKTVTIPGDTSGSWNKTNSNGMQLRFVLGCGSARLSSSINQWNNAGFDGPTGSTSVVGTNGATFYITGVQLEVGSSATSFETRAYGTELQLCQRYYEIMQQASIIGCADGSNVILCPYTYLVPKRATASITLLTPTVTVTEPTVASRTSSGATLGAGTGASSQSCIYQIFGFSSLTNQNVVMGGTAANTSILGISAEL